MRDLLMSIQLDLGDNFVETDINVLSAIYDEVVDNALRFSNRRLKTDTDTQIGILSSEIRRCVKTIYLQRGGEDVTKQTQSGIDATYDDAMERMRNDIIKNGKRILI